LPAITVHFYQDDAGRAPVLAWLRELKVADRKAYAKCVARIARLAALGHELRRPEADYLRDGIQELSIRKGRVNYRILYFFHGRRLALLANAITKEGAVPAAEIDRAADRKQLFEKAPERHTYEEDLYHG
jgi:hypothetical protein